MLLSRGKGERDKGNLARVWQNEGYFYEQKDKKIKKNHSKTLAKALHGLFYSSNNKKLAVMDDWMFVWFMASA